MTLETILRFSEEEQEALSALNRWLPVRILDSHLHCWPGNVGHGLINDRAKVPGQTFNSFNREWHSKMLSGLFPRIDCRVIMFSKPGFDGIEGNRYVREGGQEHAGILPVYLVSPNRPSDPVAQASNEGFAGLKVYPTREQKADPATRITDVFPGNFFRAAGRLSLPVIIHLPADLLANLDELLALAGAYPETRFVIAHLGNTYLYHGSFASALAAVKKRSNIRLDTAMVADSAVIAQAIISLGHDRILFGSDAPFSYIRGRHAMNEQGKIRFQSQLPFSWTNPDEYQLYRKEADGFRLMHLNIMLAVKEAISLAGLKRFEREIKETIFYLNATTIFHGGTRR